MTPKKANEWISVECGFDNIDASAIEKPVYNLRVDNYIGNEKMQYGTDSIKNDWRVEYRSNFVQSHDVKSIDGSSSDSSMSYDDTYIEYLTNCDDVNDMMCDTDRKMYINMMYETYYCWLDSVGIDTGVETKDFDWTTFDPTQVDEFKEPEKEAEYDYANFVDGDSSTYPPFNPREFSPTDAFTTVLEFSNPATFPAGFVAADYVKSDSTTWPVSVEFYTSIYWNMSFAMSPMTDGEKQPYLPEYFQPQSWWSPEPFNPATFPKSFDPASYDMADAATWPNPEVEYWDYDSRVEGESETYERFKPSYFYPGMFDPSWYNPATYPAGFDVTAYKASDETTWPVDPMWVDLENIPTETSFGKQCKAPEDFPF